MRRGFDVSKWQGDIDFNRMKSWGADFVIVKAGQGNWADPKFADNWAGAKAAGIPRGSYWYWDNRYDPKAQARKYVDIIKDDPEGVCWLDLEDKNVGIYSSWRNWYDFIVEFQRLCNSPVGIYTGYYYFTEQTAHAGTLEKSWFGQFPLWLAWYFSDPFNPRHESVLLPFPWATKGYLILQSGTPAIGAAAGVSGSREIDYNIFMGTDDQYRAYFKVASGEPTTPPQEEGIMHRYEAVSTFSMSLRPDHNTNNSPLASCSAQFRMQGDELWTATGERWLKVLTINGQPIKNAAGQVVPSAWVAVEAASRIYCNLTEPNPPAPEPVDEFPPRIGVTLDGTTIRWYVPE